MGFTVEGSKLKGQMAYAWFKESRTKMHDARKKADTCGEYYDGEQWSKVDLAELEERKQPPTTNNHIKPTLDLVLGTETKVRVDYKAFPKTGAHVQDADVITHLMKYVVDQSKGEYVLSDAFAGMVKPGWAIVEVYKDSNPFKEPCRIRAVHRDHIHWDPYSRDWDWDDAKYLIRAKWMDLEDAIALYPEYADALKGAINQDPEITHKQPYEITGDEADPHGSVFDWEEGDVASKDWIDKARSRVRLLEVWYKVPTKVFILEDLQTGIKEEVNWKDPMIVDRLMGDVRVFQATIKKVRLGTVAGPNVMEDNWSPYRHNKYPFVPFWGFMRDKDHTPYGLILQMMSPQDEINKRGSKSLHILNSAQVITEERDDEKIEEIRKEAARPDGVLRARKGARLEVNRDTNLAQAQYEMYRDAVGQINQVSGINADMMAQKTNAQSGKAIETRIVQGNTLLATLFDNYRRSRQLVGELLFAIMQQYMTVPQQIRVIDQGQQGFVTINEKYTDEETGQQSIRNDVARARVDIKIDEEAYHATIREAMMEQMMDLVGKLSQSMPEVALALLDLVASYSDVPGRDEIVNRIRMIQAQMGMGSPEPQATT